MKRCFLKYIQENVIDPIKQLNTRGICMLEANSSIFDGSWHNTLYLQTKHWENYCRIILGYPLLIQKEIRCNYQYKYMYFKLFNEIIQHSK